MAKKLFDNAMKSEREQTPDHSPNGNIYLEWQYEKDHAKLFTSYEPEDGEAIENWL